MLIRFGVTNNLSIRDTQELSMVASSLKDDDAGLIQVPRSTTMRLVPTSVIYGSNASGKSNILKSLISFRSAVVNSHRRSEPGKGVPRSPFRLVTDAKTMPTQFDIDFVAEGVRYHYGFTANDEAYLSEWLYAFPAGRRQMLFERAGQIFEFGRALRGRNRVIADLTRNNSLFLSAAAQNDHEDLLPILMYFQSWNFDAEVNVSDTDLAAHFNDNDPDTRSLSFLQKIGTGIVGTTKKKVVIDEERRKKISIITKAYLDANSGVNISEAEIDTEIISRLNKIHFLHKSSDGSVVAFSPADESDGTRRLIILLDTVFHALDSGSLLIVDEINASLHTKAAEAILALFNDSASNPHGAQLIATTHDTNLLRVPGLRRDQVWFAEKDEGGATHLYPLSDFRTRLGDNFEKGYLQGRYGAIPFAGDARSLLHRDG